MVAGYEVELAVLGVRHHRAKLHVESVATCAAWQERVANTDVPIDALREKKKKKNMQTIAIRTWTARGEQAGLPP